MHLNTRKSGYLLYPLPPIHAANPAAAIEQATKQQKGLVGRCTIRAKHTSNFGLTPALGRRNGATTFEQHTNSLSCQVVLVNN